MCAFKVLIKYFEYFTAINCNEINSLLLFLNYLDNDFKAFIINSSTPIPS